MNRAFLASALLALLVFSPAAAQVSALPAPVWANVSAGLRTFTVAADVAVARANVARARPLAGRVTLNLGRWGFTAGAGALLDPDGPEALTLGASAGLDFYAASPRKPTLTLHGGVGRAQSARNDEPARWDVPAGVAFSWYLPALDLTLEPWVSPRAHLRVLEGNASGPSGTNIGAGASGGLNLTHVNGPGLHLATDGLWIGNPAGSGSKIEWVFSAGVHLKLALR